MLRRFDAIGFSLFGSGDAEIALFAPILKFKGEYGQYKPGIISSVGLKLIETDILDEEEDEGVTFDLYGGITRFNNSKIERIVMEVMRDKMLQTLMISSEGNAIAPYEGGFDVFPNQIEEVDRLRSLFPSWLSDRWDGL